MSKTTLVTGGAKSGKSRFAEGLCLASGDSPCYIATAQPFDIEMEHRISKHRSRRGEAWTTIEEPFRLHEALQTADGNCSSILVDCLTLWISNLVLSIDAGDNNPSALIIDNVRELSGTLLRMKTPVVLVTNEVGMGIVPENRLARLFRDIAGEANQLIAASADNVYAVMSGLPIKLK